MNTEVVLLFHMNIFRSSRISDVLKQEGYTCLICTAQDEGTPLKDLFGSSKSSGTRHGKTSNISSTSETALKEELIVIGTFTEADHNRILSLLKENDAGDTLKAVLTGTNGFWTVRQLYTELTRERAYVQQMLHDGKALN